MSKIQGGAHGRLNPYMIIPQARVLTHVGNISLLKSSQDAAIPIDRPPDNTSSIDD